MKQRKYFDFYASVGRKIVPNPDYPTEVEVLLDDMKYARIHGAAFLMNSAEEYSFVYGNKQGIELAKNNPRLVPIGVVPTTAQLETGDKDYYRNLIKNGACALAVTPGMKCPIRPKNMASIAEALTESGRSLIIPGAAADTVLSQIDDICSAYPELSVIMQGCNWGTGRAALDMLCRNENLHFEITSFHLNELFKIAKDNFGIDRVLYSSSWPVKSMGALKSYIEYADITEEEKDMVAHGNACRLFGLSIDDFSLYDDSECQLDSIACEADAGIPISVPVIDAHTHMIGSDDKAVNNCIMLYSDCDSMYEKMNKMGVDSVITAPWSGISLDGIKGNEESLYAAQKYPGRFYGYITCNVNHKEDLAAWKEYCEKYPDVFVGIKPYPPYQKFDYSDDIVKPWFEYANEHHLPALIHAESIGDINMVEPIVGKYPNVTFILAHAGSSFATARRGIKLAKEYENVVLEITYTTTGRGMVEFLVENVGADRVLYGSDSPMRDPVPQLAWVCFAKISEEDKKKILSGNIKRILNKRK